MVAVSASGRVLRRLPPCLGPRTLDGRYVACAVPFPGDDNTYDDGFELRVVDTLTGSVRTVFRDTRESRWEASTPVWSPDGRSLAIHLHRQSGFTDQGPPGRPVLVASYHQDFLALIDRATGTLRTVAEQPPEPKPCPQGRCATIVPRAWTGDGSALLMEVGRPLSTSFEVLNPATGARHSLPSAFGYVPAPNQRTLLKRDGDSRTLTGRASLVDLNGRLLSQLPVTKPRYPWTDWSPDSRYVNNAESGRLYDRVTRKTTIRTIPTWAPDSRHYAIRAGAWIELRTVATGRFVRRLFRVPSGYSPVLHWMVGPRDLELVAT
jgi:hypothetical protein